MSEGPEVGDPAPDGTLMDIDGQPVPVSSAWSGRPAVLVFLRYFGCPLCQVQVVGLRNDEDQFDEAGANVILIGHPDPEAGMRFRDAKHIPFPCLLDADRRVYRAYGLTRFGFVQAFGLNALGPMMKANLHRETRQGGLQGGNLLQMPGTFLVSPDGIIRLVHRNKTIADFPPSHVLLQAIAALPHG